MSDIHTILIKRLQISLDNSILCPDDNEPPPSAIYRKAVYPAGQFGLIWPGVAIHALDMACGLVTGAASILSLGLSPKINTLSRNFFNSSRNLTADILAGVLKTININSNGLTDHFDSDTEQLYFGVRGEYIEEGSCAKEAVKFFERGNEAAAHNNFFVRHVFSRIFFGLSIPCFVIARVCDFAIGFFTGLMAICFRGENENLNRMAYRHLKITALAGDIVDCIRKIINPRSISRGTDPADEPWFGLLPINNKTVPNNNGIQSFPLHAS